MAEPMNQSVSQFANGRNKLIADIDAQRFIDETPEAEIIKVPANQSPSQFADMRAKSIIGSMETGDTDLQVALTGEANEDQVELDERTIKLQSYLKEKENSYTNPNGGWNEEKGLWFPHRSPEGGTDTIAWGHKITEAEEKAGTFKNGLTAEQAEALFQKDYRDHYDEISKEVPAFEAYPDYLKEKIISETYRGLFLGSPDTIELMNEGKYGDAAIEYTRGVDEYKGTKGQGVVDRMDELIDALKQYEIDIYLD